MTEIIQREVRDHYAAAALRVLEPQATRADACCSDGCCSDPAADDTVERLIALDYTLADREALPDAAALASLGCGNPVAVAELREGETVLDLGAGGGIDVLLSASRVGPTGHAYGLDMTDEMLALARRNAAEVGARNVTFLHGHIEAVPLPDASVDVVISNCVVNLSPDKGQVFREIGRVLRPGGRLGISDIVAEDHLDPAERAERGSYAGCIAGALSFAEYRAGLAEAGLEDISITASHPAADGMWSAIIRARKPD